MRLKPALAIMYGLAIGLAPTAALAATSTQGSNYSTDWNELWGAFIKTCDQESDGRHVYAEYQLDTGEWSEVTDGNGANNSCSQRGRYSGFIQHRTCEAIDFAPDSCGNYVYP